MSKCCPIAWMTVRRTSSTTSLSLLKIAQIARWKIVIRSGKTPE